MGSLQMSGEVTRVTLTMLHHSSFQPGGTGKPKQRVPVLSPDIQGKKAIPQVIPQTFIKDRMRGRNCARPTKSRRDQSTPDLQTRTEVGIVQMHVNAGRSPRRRRLTRGEGYCVATLTWFANTERKVTENSARRLQPATGSVVVPGCGRSLRPNPETPPPGRANSN